MVNVKVWIKVRFEVKVEVRGPRNHVWRDIEDQTEAQTKKVSDTRTHTHTSQTLCCSCFELQNAMRIPVRSWYERCVV